MPELAPVRPAGPFPIPYRLEDTLGNDDRTYAELTTFNEDMGVIEKIGKAECWVVVKQEDQPFNGITFALEGGTDLTISDETLAALGYAKA